MTPDRPRPGLRASASALLRRDAGPPRSLVALANRLPIVRTRGVWRLAPGGLVTALLPAMTRRGGAWVGWEGSTETVPRRLEGLDFDLHAVTLSRAELQGYYYGFANRTIWPLFHDLLETPVFDSNWWRAYEAVNEHFAEVTAGIPAGPTAPLLWVHDYHLMLLPDLLRQARPDSPIGFFLHIPFPPPELFARLPWRAEILRGLLGADVVAFHADRYRRNFVEACANILGLTSPDDRHVRTEDGRVVDTAAHPISIDAVEFAELADDRQVQRELFRLRTQFAGRRVLLGVDRLDYTKGIPERLRAVELLLERREDLRTRIAFVQVAVPSRDDVKEYRELRQEVELEVGRINGRFTEPGHDVPVHYLYRNMSRPRLGAYYLIADVALVTPKKDGMNLIAKEFVVTQAAGGAAGALVLSEFAGAAKQLDQAVMCNPFDVEGLSMCIEQALELDEDDRRSRLLSMAAGVHRDDVYAWVDAEIAAVERAAARR